MDSAATNSTEDSLPPPAAGVGGGGGGGGGGQASPRGAGSPELRPEQKRKPNTRHRLNLKTNQRSPLARCVHHDIWIPAVDSLSNPCC